MTNIQRWRITGQPDPWMEPDDNGEVVDYADHVEALRQAEQRGREFVLSVWRQDGYDEEKRMTHMYKQGQRDALAGAVQRVSESIPSWEEPIHGWIVVSLKDVIAAIKGE